MATAKPPILVFDDDPDVTDHLAIVLADLGHPVVAVADFDEFRLRLQDAMPALIVLDLIMPGTDGVETLRFLASVGYQGRLLLVSAADAEVVAAARALGELQGLAIIDALSKPYSIAALYEAAERALEQAPPDLAPTRRLVERDVRTLVESGFLRVFYQPKRRISDGSICGFEALARCWHPEFGMLAPASFLYVVERSPLLERLTAEVIGMTLADMQHWRNRGYRVRVAVNLAARSLSNLGLPDKLRALARRHDIALEDLTVEVTETTLSGEHVATLDVLTRLRIMGVDLAIDDFGSGYSNQARLEKMPFNQMKIDRGLIAGSDRLNLAQPRRAMPQTLSRTCLDIGGRRG